MQAAPLCWCGRVAPPHPHASALGCPIPHQPPPPLFTASALPSPVPLRPTAAQLAPFLPPNFPLFTPLGASAATLAAPFPAVPTPGPPLPFPVLPPFPLPRLLGGPGLASPLSQPQVDQHMGTGSTPQPMVDLFSVASSTAAAAASSSSSSSSSAAAAAAAAAADEDAEIAALGTELLAPLDPDHAVATTLTASEQAHLAELLAAIPPASGKTPPPTLPKLLPDGSSIVPPPDTVFPPLPHNFHTSEPFGRADHLFHRIDLSPGAATSQPRLLLRPDVRSAAHIYMCNMCSLRLHIDAPANDLGITSDVIWACLRCLDAEGFPLRVLCEFCVDAWEEGFVLKEHRPAGQPPHQLYRTSYPILSAALQPGAAGNPLADRNRVPPCTLCGERAGTFYYTCFECADTAAPFYACHDCAVHKAYRQPSAPVPLDSGSDHGYALEFMSPLHAKNLLACDDLRTFSQPRPRFVTGHGGKLKELLLGASEWLWASHNLVDTVEVDMIVWTPRVGYKDGDPCSVSLWLDASKIDVPANAHKATRRNRLSAARRLGISPHSVAMQALKLARDSGYSTTAQLGVRRMDVTDFARNYPEQFEFFCYYVRQRSEEKKLPGVCEALLAFVMARRCTHATFTRAIYIPAAIDVMNYFTRRNKETGKLESCMPDPVRRLLQFTRPPLHSDEQAALSYYQDHGEPHNRPDRTATWLWSLPVRCAKIDPDPLEWLETQVDLLSFTPEIAAYKLGFGQPLPAPQPLPGCDEFGRALPSSSGSVSAVAAGVGVPVSASVVSAPVSGSSAVSEAAAAAASAASASSAVLDDVRGRPFVALDAGRATPAPSKEKLMLLVPEKLGLAHFFYHQRGTRPFTNQLLSGREAARGVDVMEREGYQDPAFSARLGAALGVAFDQGIEYQKWLAALAAARRVEVERQAAAAARTVHIHWSPEEREWLFAKRAADALAHPDPAARLTHAQLAEALGAEGARRGLPHRVWPSAPARSGGAIAFFLKREREAAVAAPAAGAAAAAAAATSLGGAAGSSDA